MGKKINIEMKKRIAFALSSTLALQGVVSAEVVEAINQKVPHVIEGEMGYTTPSAIQLLLDGQFVGNYVTEYLFSDRIGAQVNETISTIEWPDGLLKINGNDRMYYHDSSHGLAIKGDGSFEIKVAGNAQVTFELCSYSAEGTIKANIQDGTGSLNVSSLPLASTVEGEKVTFQYTGEATTLIFDITGVKSTQCYLHSITVENEYDFPAEDDTDNIHGVSMPQILGQGLTMGQNLNELTALHTDKSASMDDLKGVGYYLFDAREDQCILEADIKINEIGAGNKYGVFVGMFNPTGDVSSIATLGIRGKGTIRNLYNKEKGADKKIGAGGINQTFQVGETIHVVVRKEDKGWYTEFSSDSVSESRMIKYSETAYLDDASSPVRYGFAFSNVNATITNLKLTSEAGEVLYDQNQTFEIVGVPPTVTEVFAPIISDDRSSITVNWEGEECIGDAAYHVELSKDGGQTFTSLAKNVKEKTYTTAVDVSGEYVFRISGVCGTEESNVKMCSSTVVVTVPLVAPLIEGQGHLEHITLQWNAVNQATSYQIYRKSPDEADYQLITTTNEIQYEDTTVENEVLYDYHIIAVSDDQNTSMPSNTVRLLASNGREGQYVYEQEAATISITQKSNDTIYKAQSILEGTVDREGKLELEVNGNIQESINLGLGEAFKFEAQLEQGRNDVNLLFTDEQGKVTRKTFNFVYLTNYHIVVDSQYTGVDGACIEGTEIRQYSTVQEAVNSVSAKNTEHVVILIKEGNYTEYLRVESPYITLIGEDREKVNINFYDATITPVGGKTDLRCSVYIKKSAHHFAAENLTFENTYEYLGDGSISNESADALRVDADESTFVNVKLVGYQDTLQANTNHQYYYKCYITGNIDYIYGRAQALFEDCELVFRYSKAKNSGYITAPKTDVDKAYGYIFNECQIYAEPDCSGSKYLLARPWGQDASVAFINTYMGQIINKTRSYDDMSGNTYENARFSEYYSYGPGHAVHSDRPQISETEAMSMLTPEFLEWNPYETSEQIAEDFIGNIIHEEDEVVTDYIVSLDYQGATSECDLESITVKAGDCYIGLPEPKKEGHIFLGWYTANGMKVTEGMIMLEEANHTLYAGWQQEVNSDDCPGNDEPVEVVKVTLDYQGATSDCEMEYLEVKVGESYTNLPRPKKKGYVFYGWYTVDGIRVTSQTVADSEDHVLYAKWQKESSDDVDDTQDTDDNIITNDGQENNSNQNDNKNEIVSDNENSVDKEEVQQNPVQSFNDVSEHWALESIDYVTSKGILKGVAENQFEPETPMTRAMFATVLHRLAGEVEVSTDLAFKDVKAGAWYEKAILWADEQGIVNGTDGQVFNPNEPITREQLATMLYRYIQVMEIDVPIVEATTIFKDQDNIAKWALEATNFMVSTGIIEGNQNKNYNPSKSATRAEVSTILARFLKGLE